MKLFKITVKLLGLLLLILWLSFEVIPGPIEGNYHYISRVSCLCDSVNFLKFEGGSIRRYSAAGDESPGHGLSRNWGEYRKLENGKFHVQTFATIDDQSTFTMTIRPTLLALRVSEMTPAANGWFDKLITRIPFGSKYSRIIEEDRIAWSGQQEAVERPGTSPGF